MPRQGNGNGSIVRLKSGNWWVRVSTPDGKRRTVGTYKTKTDAEKARREILGRVDTGVWAPPEDESPLVADYAQGWLASMAIDPDRKQSTLDQYTDIMNLFVFRPLASPTGKGTIRLGDMRMSAVKPPYIRQWRDAVLADVRARATKRQHKPISEHYGQGQTAVAYRTIKAMFNYAVSEYVIERTPCLIRGGGVNKNKQERVAVPIEDVRRIADLMPPQKATAVWISATAGGLRIGEVTALRRRDIEIERNDAGEIVGGWVDVSRSAYWARGAKEPTYGAPKTTASNRNPWLPESVAKLVAGHLGWYVPDDPDALLFTDESGGPLRNDVLRRAFDRARVKIGHPEYVFHGLRYTYASTLSAANVPPRYTQAAGGWATAAMANHYTKPLGDMWERIAKAQADVIGL